MSKNFLLVNWKAINGSAKQKRILRLRPDERGMFMCAVKGCLHKGFKSSRGLRKHIESRHSWYFYFDEEPSIKREMIDGIKEKLKQPTNNIPSFSTTDGIGQLFVNWLLTPLGGDKSKREAIQIARRAMKFLMAALGDTEDGSNATGEYVDCCLGSPSTVMKFMESLSTEWGLTSSAALNYLKAMSDLLDFRKAHGITDAVLRSFAVTEVYIRRGKENLRKRKAMEYGRNLDLESLIARDSWASMEEMEQVIPYHAARFKSVVDACEQKENVPSAGELAFATRFVVTYLFVRVKCSRPMTFQYMTMDMVAKARTNGGFIDQTEFKTASKYTFDTLIITEEVMKVLGMYINSVRPCLHPCCDYVLVTNNGTQYSAFATAMALLVKQAIGKYINPTRYRQIVETESAKRLSAEDQQVLSKDQKHSSKVAERSYKKQMSREVATKGKNCIEKMLGESREQSTKQLGEILDTISTIENDFDQNLLSSVGNIIQDSGKVRYNESLDSACTSPCSSEHNTQDDSVFSDVVITGIKSPKKNVSGEKSDPVTNLPMWPDGNVHVKVKQETHEKKRLSVKSLNKFSHEEDKNLYKGLQKHGKGQWSRILKDPELSFNERRTRDTLRMRAESASFRHSLKL